MNNNFSVEDVLLGAYGNTQLSEDIKVHTSTSYEAWNDSYSAEVAYAENELDIVLTDIDLGHINSKERMNVLKRFNRDYVSGRGTENLQNYMNENIKSTEEEAGISTVAPAPDAKDGGEKKKGPNVFKKIWGAICKFFKAILEKLKALGRWFVGLFKKKNVTEPVIKEAIVKANNSPLTVQKIVAAIKDELSQQEKGGANATGKGTVPCFKNFDGGKLAKINESLLSDLPQIMAVVPKMIKHISDDKSTFGSDKNPDKSAPAMAGITQTLSKYKMYLEPSLKGAKDYTEIYNSFGIVIAVPKRIMDITGAPDQFARLSMMMVGINSKDAELQKVISAIDSSLKELSVPENDKQFGKLQSFRDGMTMLRNLLSIHSTVVVKITKIVAKIVTIVTSEGIMSGTGNELSAADKAAKAKAKSDAAIAAGKASA